MENYNREIFIHIVETVSCKKIKMESQKGVSNDFLAEDKLRLVAARSNAIPLYSNGKFSFFRGPTFDIFFNEHSCISTSNSSTAQVGSSRLAYIAISSQ